MTNCLLKLLGDFRTFCTDIVLYGKKFKMKMFSCLNSDFKQKSMDVPRTRLRGRSRFRKTPILHIFLESIVPLIHKNVGTKPPMPEKAYRREWALRAILMKLAVYASSMV
jgi:hypothetical protein